MRQMRLAAQRGAHLNVTLEGTFVGLLKVACRHLRAFLKALRRKLGFDGYLLMPPQVFSTEDQAGDAQLESSELLLQVDCASDITALKTLLRVYTGEYVLSDSKEPEVVFEVEQTFPPCMPRLPASAGWAWPETPMLLCDAGATLLG